LRELRLWGNFLQKVPDSIGNLNLLETLLLPINQIEDLPESISRLQELNDLDLGHISARSSNEFELDHRDARSIGQAGNPFKILPDCLQHLIKLSSLGLDDCQLTSLPDWLCQLPNLQLLFLRENNLRDLPSALSKLDQLKEIRLEDNPLTPDLAAAYEQGIEAVMQYLKSRAEGEVNLNEAKLILVGEGEVGKSCLLGALRGDEWVDGRPTTHGIEIKPVHVTAPDCGTEITLNGWDFGGQRVYRPTHQLFFSPSAVYLVVWKPREGSQQGFVKEWIMLILRREPDAKILVVATHGELGQRQADLDRQDLIDLFGNDTILGFFHVDSKPTQENQYCHGITELKAAIAKISATLPGMGRVVPTKWRHIRELLETSGKTHLPYKEVISLCESQGLEGFAAELFVLVSHTLGYLIHYNYDPTLRDIVILKPDWLAKAISYVLDDETTRKSNGLVKFDYLSQIWSHPPFLGEVGYPKELHSVFLRLMERFDLSYKVVLDPAASVESTTSLIAQLVPDNRPTQLPDWGEEPATGDRQQSQICRIVDDRGQRANAEGLLYQLIVRLHKYSLGRAKYENSVHWQRGLMLDHDYNGRALLEHIGTDVKITVRAAYPERFLSYLTEEVKWLIENFWKGLRCNVMVPCLEPCGMNTPGYGLFEVQKLIESKKKNRPEFPCTVSGCNEWQNIDRLLNNAPITPTLSQNIGIEQVRKVMKDELVVIRQDLMTLDSRDERRFRSLSQDQRAIMSQIDRQFADMMQMFVDEAKEGPRLLSFKPIDPGFFDRPKWIAEKFQLTLWCEHARQPLPNLNPSNPKLGVYELELNREWFDRAIPYFKLMTGTLSLILPVAASATKLMLDDSTFKSIEKDLDLGQKSIESSIKGGNNAVDWLGKKGDSSEFDRGDAIHAQGSTLRELHALLKDKDPGFGGLVRVQNKRREFLWVHEQFVDEY
jgi:internalin A